jgi:hypothetical protein
VNPETIPGYSPLDPSSPDSVRLTLADYIVLLVVAAVLGISSWYLIRSGVNLEPLLDGVEQCGPWAQAESCEKVLETGDVVLIVTTYSIAWRRNATILIASCITLIGCLIVLLRVRGAMRAVASGQLGKINVATDSAGLLICLLGILLLAGASLVPTHAVRDTRGAGGEQEFEDQGPEGEVPHGLDALSITGPQPEEAQSEEEE